MPYSQFDRTKLHIKPLSERVNKVRIERDYVHLDQKPADTTDEFRRVVANSVARIKKARVKKAPVMLTFGAHSIKNGLGPLMIRMMEDGWLTHLATNGAGIIHDWEFAFQGKTGEDVCENVKNGQFGIWDETGLFINLALLTGAWEGLGYGESVGKMISVEGLNIPDSQFLLSEADRMKESDPERASAAIDLAAALIPRSEGHPGPQSILLVPYNSEHRPARAPC